MPNNSTKSMPTRGKVMLAIQTNTLMIIRFLTMGGKLGFMGWY
jgi:hypothetical protein